jgi:hypothetical protein
MSSTQISFTFYLSIFLSVFPLQLFFLHSSFVLVFLHSFSLIYFVIIFKPSSIFFYHLSSGFIICGFATLNLIFSCPLDIV